MKRRKFIPIDWNTINWHQSTQTICRETGKPQSSVSNARRKYSPETRQKFRIRNKLNSPKFDWTGIPWASWGDDLVASMSKCSRNTVDRNRRRYAPETVGIHTTDPRILRWKKVDWTDTDGFIAARLHVSIETVKLHRKKQQ